MKKRICVFIFSIMLSSLTMLGWDKKQPKTSSQADASANAKGGNAKQSQQQTQSNQQTQSTSLTGSNNTTLQYHEVRQVAPAIAPDSFPSAPCIKGYGGAVQTGFAGASIGGGKVDRGCDDRETARSFALMGNRLAAEKILCGTPAAKRAHLTMEECMKNEEAPPEPLPPPEIRVEPKIEVVPIPVPEPAGPPSGNVVPPTPKFERRLAGVCVFPSDFVGCSSEGEKGSIVHVDQLHITKPCKQMLDAAIAELVEYPESTIEVEGNVSSDENKDFLANNRVDRVRRYLLDKGIALDRIKTNLSFGHNNTVKLWINAPAAQ